MIEESIYIPRDKVSASFASLAHSAIADVLRAWPLKDGKKRDALLCFVWLVHRASEPATGSGSTYLAKSRLGCDHGQFPFRRPLASNLTLAIHFLSAPSIPWMPLGMNAATRYTILVVVIIVRAVLSCALGSR